MRMGDAAKALNVNNDTIKNWIKRKEFAPFFSPEALRSGGQIQRELNNADLMILNTIRALRSRGESNWEIIAEYIRDGEREPQFPMQAAIVEGSAPLDLYRAAAFAQKELEEAKLRIRILEDKNERLEERRISEQRELYERITKAETNLKLALQAIRFQKLGWLQIPEGEDENAAIKD